MFKRIFLTRNVATWDRWLRLLPAILSIAAYTQGWLNGPLAIGFAVTSAALIITSVTGTCSIYGLLGLSTLRQHREG